MTDASDKLRSITVALRKESVDRNKPALLRDNSVLVSLSARRAWIEIHDADGIIAAINAVALRKESVDRNGDNRRNADNNAQVALRKESVDRNIRYVMHSKQRRRSLSARRAWIEISHQRRSSAGEDVALRKESVDRNAVLGKDTAPQTGRSPQGERG